MFSPQSLFLINFSKGHSSKKFLTVIQVLIMDFLSVGLKKVLCFKSWLLIEKVRLNYHETAPKI